VNPWTPVIVHGAATHIHPSTTLKNIRALANSDDPDLDRSPRDRDFTRLFDDFRRCPGCRIKLM
jgi:hypothetical protein